MIRKPSYASLFPSSIFSIQNVLVKHFCSNVEINAISKENIKPSSPAPNHLRTFNLSLFCQLAPVVYSLFILYYPNRDGHPKLDDKLATLKCSLSKTLTHFYPLAGRIKDLTSIDCNDEGASYTVARVSCQMSEFLNPPRTDLLGMFLPCEPICKEPAQLAPQIAIKVNTFSCGGIAISIGILHKIIDAYVLTSFLKEWAAIGRGDSNKAPVHNLAASIFPQNECVNHLDFSYLETYSNNEGMGCSRRFVFNSEAISALRSRARSESVPNPTTYEVLCAFLWKSAFNASSTKSGMQRPSVAFNATNVRLRMKSSMPDYSIGNLIWSATACYNPTIDTNMELHHLASLIRKSLEKVNGDFVQKMEGKEGYKELCNAFDEVREMYSRLDKPVLSYCFTSGRKIGFYDVDFGWGEPIWVSTGGDGQAMFSNAFALMDGRCGDEIEAWLYLDECEMDDVERDPEFIKYATLNPSIQF